MNEVRVCVEFAEPGRLKNVFKKSQKHPKRHFKDNT